MNVISSILLWASVALLIASVGVLVGAAISARRRSSMRRLRASAHDALALRAISESAVVRKSAQTNRRLVVVPSVHAPSAAQHYAMDDSTYVELKTEIVEAFTRAELELDLSVAYRSLNNFEKEPRMMELSVA